MDMATWRGCSSEGLVNTDSIDWVETAAGGVRRKMIERPLGVDSVVHLRLEGTMIGVQDIMLAKHAFFLFLISLMGLYNVTAHTHTHPHIMGRSVVNLKLLR